MPDVVFSVFNEKFMTPSKLVDLSLKFGSIGLSMLFDCFPLCLQDGIHEITVPLRRLFATPKAFFVKGYTLGS